ncbi:MAG: flagellar hook-basal body complex protein FliE [Acidimicrobiales bacterium]
MISPVGGVSVAGLGGRVESARYAAAAESSDTSIADQIGGALDSLGAAERRADAASRAAATGDLSSISDFMMATTEAQLMTEVTVAVRNRAVEAFNEIMRMQV